ncbi:hypothetical protein RRG08_012923 [Elysia crispata]|uniref:C-type lectin domain-containing protein n=1 Tax=Elysia crispata TaxID=231223 RepID=A0AAE1DR53_9GAST|nr:hypothetical protein RRG08_012923 [Elysia crispata]
MAFLYFLLAAGFATVCSQSACPAGFTLIGQSCYAYVDHEQDWPKAQSTCAAMGGFIAEIFDQATNDFIVQMATKHQHRVIWLGGSDLVKSGEWVWAKSGIAVSAAFDDWAPNQLDGNKSDAQDTEDCMEMNIDKYGGHWNDDECEHKQRFIREKPASEEFIG